MFVKIQSPLDCCMVSHMLKLLSKPKLMAIKILGETSFRCPQLLQNCATRPEKSLTEALHYYRVLGCLLVNSEQVDFAVSKWSAWHRFHARPGDCRDPHLWEIGDSKISRRPRLKISLQSPLSRRVAPRKGDWRLIFNRGLRDDFAVSDFPEVRMSITTR